MRNRIKSLTMAHGAPTFFITFAPVDISSPICMHLAGEPIDLNVYAPALPDYFRRLQVVAQNPVAGADYLKLMTDLFVEVLLGTKHEDKQGLFGQTKSYFGTVESQGRMTLHLHCLVWLENAWSPQQIKDRLLVEQEKGGKFTERLTQFLEERVQGQFGRGTADVEAAVAEKRRSSHDGCINGAHRRQQCDCRYEKEICCLPKNLLPEEKHRASFDKAAASIRLEGEAVVLESNVHLHDANRKESTNAAGRALHAGPGFRAQCSRLA
jgi:hypothetical protein